MSPLLYFSIPSFLIIKYSLLLKLSLGTYAPAILLGTAAYSALKRYEWLTGSSSIKGAKVVKSLKLINNDELEIKSLNYIIPQVIKILIL